MLKELKPHGATLFCGSGILGNMQGTVNADSQVQGRSGVVRGGIENAAGAGYVKCSQTSRCVR
jgi:hypothetical protein